MTTQQTPVGSMLREGVAIAVRFARARTGSFLLAVLGAALFVSAIVASALVIGRVTDELIVPVLDKGAGYGKLIWPAMWAVIGVSSLFPSLADYFMRLAMMENRMFLDWRGMLINSWDSS